MIPHSTKNSVEKVNKFKENDEERFSQLCDLETKLIDEAIIAMKNNDAAAFGLKMSENQKYLEEIQISNDTLRDMISSLKEISLGTKITGAGDGGCIIALVKENVYGSKNHMEDGKEEWMHQCNRCRHTWFSKKKIPKACQECRSPYWNKVPAFLPKDKEYFSAKIDTKGVVWSTIEE